MDPSLTDILRYAAAGLVLATFSFRSITALRSVAIASNLLFIAYAAFASLLPVLVLHAVLLPLNLLRLRQALALPERCAEQARGHWRTAGIRPPGRRRSRRRCRCSAASLAARSARARFGPLPGTTLKGSRS